MLLLNDSLRNSWESERAAIEQIRDSVEKGHYFLDAKGSKKKVWQIGQGKRCVEHEVIFDLQTGVKLSCDIWRDPAWHPSYTYQLYVIKVRVRKKVWYAVTNERVVTA